MRKNISAILIFSSCIVFNIVCAYETPTHSDISEETVDISVLELDPTLLESLGIEINIDTPAFPSLVPENQEVKDSEIIWKENASITEIISGSAMLEDEGIRVLNHFFDPLHDRPADPAPPLVTLHRSIDWATEINAAGERIQITDPQQDFSFSDAIDYFYEALTKATEKTPEGYLWK